MKKLLLLSLFFIGCNPGKLCVYRVTVMGATPAQLYVVDTQYSYCSLDISREHLRVQSLLVEETENSSLEMSKFLGKYITK